MVDFKKHLGRTPRLDLNPSAADRWTTCTASPQFILDNWDKLPPSDTVFSLEGTTAHTIAKNTLLEIETNYYTLSEAPTPVTPEMRWHAWNYAEYVNNLREPGSKLLVEQKLPLWYMPGRNAIVDAAVINPSSLHVIDYKYGEGVAVSPERNLQMAIYTRSVIENDRTVIPNSLRHAAPVSLHIYQPRGRDAEEPFKVWETTWGEVHQLTCKIEQKATNVKMGGDVVFAPSDKACQWCQAKAICPERQKQLTAGISDLTVIPDGDKHLRPVQAVSLAELAAIVKHGPAIIKWVKDAQAYALAWMKEGHTVPGFKLVTGRQGDRAWMDEKAAAKLLLETTILKEEEVWTKKLISVAQVEEKLGKKVFKKELTNLVTRSPGQQVIAPIDDKRESVSIDGASEFTAIE